MQKGYTAVSEDLPKIQSALKFVWPTDCYYFLRHFEVLKSLFSFAVHSQAVTAKMFKEGMRTEARHVKK